MRKKPSCYNRLGIAPNRLSFVIFAPDANMREEVNEFNSFLEKNQIRKWVQIGMMSEYDVKIFDFKMNTLHMKKEEWFKIVDYFLSKGFQIDEERSEIGALNYLRRRAEC